MQKNIGTFLMVIINESIKICAFEENGILISFIKAIIIDNNSLQDIFNKNLDTDLYVL